MTTRLTSRLKRRSVGFPLLIAVLASLAVSPARAATTFTLAIAKPGNGGGSVTSAPSGIDCGLTCSFDFSSGSLVDLSAAADPDSTFEGWSGGGCSGTGPCQVSMDAAVSVTAMFRRLYRPDAWLKLCGPGDTCLHAPPHPWRGNNIYNGTGRKQTVSSGVEEGNDIRFWILIQNDGALGDSIFVKGCPGNRGFVIRYVLIGAYKRSQGGVVITRQFKAGTAKFNFAPAATQTNVVITLDIWVKTAVFGARYTCPITVSSAATPTLKDRVVAKMVTI